MITVPNSSESQAVIEIFNYLGNKTATFRVDNAINTISVKDFSAGVNKSLSWVVLLP